MGWEKEFRPQRFDELVGQTHAVRLLSRLVLHRTKGRHLLLHGTVGTGKTTLARLFIRALNCLNVDRNGSPCGHCKMCKSDPEMYLLELDVPRRFRTINDIKEYIKQFQRPTEVPRVKMIFFDEAHHLEPTAQDFLLKAIEDTPEGVLYCFATTEAERLRPALVSRLWSIRIRPLMPNDAVQLLESVAAKTNLSYDREALFLIAAMKPPFARDLVTALEEVHKFDAKIDTALVKAVFDLDSFDHLTQYCIALARGDRNGQTNTMGAWRIPIAEKISLVLRFLTTTYYHEILGQRVCFDSMAESLTPAREVVVQSLHERIGSRTHQDLAPHFRHMLDFWVDTRLDGDELLYLKLALFETYMNNDVADLLTTADTSSDYMRRTDQEAARRPSIHQGCSVDPQWDSVGGPPASRYLEEQHVALVVNRASFLIQHYNLYLNSAIHLDLSFDDGDRDDTAFRTLETVCRDLSAELSPKAIIATLDRTGPRLSGHIASHVPQAEEPAVIKKIELFCNKWQDSIRRPVLRVTSKGASPNKIHWEIALGLLRGYKATNGMDDVLKRLKLKAPSNRATGPLDCQRVIFSPELSEASVSAASLNGMLPLSAYDARQWDWVTSGWEAKEYPNRMREIREREQRTSQLQNEWRDDEVELRAALKVQHSYWQQQEPEFRKRDWTGWW